MLTTMLIALGEDSSITMAGLSEKLQVETTMVDQLCQQLVLMGYLEPKVEQREHICNCDGNCGENCRCKGRSKCGYALTENGYNAVKNCLYSTRTYGVSC